MAERRHSNQQLKYAIAAPAAAFGVALAVTALALLAGGKDPILAFRRMADYGSSIDSVVVTINEALPLFIAGLAVAVGFRTNLFNIGVEGQYRLAALLGAAIGVNTPGPGFVKIISTMVCAVIVGAVWAGIAGVLKAYRNVNEVIATIMMNGIVASLIGILLKWGPVAKIERQQFRTKLFPKSAWFPSINIRGSDLYLWVLVAAAVGVVVHLLINRTRFGFDLRASGINPGAALTSGVNPKRMIVTTMLISGGLAGLVGMPILLHKSHQVTQDFPTQLGFTGIAVALVGRQKVPGIAVAALLFSFITRVSQSLTDPPLEAPKEIGIIMQGTMILSAVVAYEVVRRRAEAEAVRAAAERTAAMTGATA
jgi:general nucleoside transport system permease protein